MSLDFSVWLLFHIGCGSENSPVSGGDEFLVCNFRHVGRTLRYTFVDKVHFPHKFLADIALFSYIPMDKDHMIANEELILSYATQCGRKVH